MVRLPVKFLLSKPPCSWPSKKSRAGIGEVRNSRHLAVVKIGILPEGLLLLGLLLLGLLLSHLFGGLERAANSLHMHGQLRAALRLLPLHYRQCAGKLFVGRSINSGNGHQKARRRSGGGVDDTLPKLLFASLRLRNVLIVLRLSLRPARFADAGCKLRRTARGARLASPGAD